MEIIHALVMKITIDRFGSDDKNGPYGDAKTWLYHTDYLELTQQQWRRPPINGVGLWAETQIFGGVVHFDRGDSEREVSQAIFLSSIESIRIQPTLLDPPCLHPPRRLPIPSLPNR